MRTHPNLFPVIVFLEGANIKYLLDASWSAQVQVRHKYARVIRRSFIYGYCRKFFASRQPVVTIKLQRSDFGTKWHVLSYQEVIGICECSFESVYIKRISFNYQLEFLKCKILVASKMFYFITTWETPPSNWHAFPPMWHSLVSLCDQFHYRKAPHCLLFESLGNLR